MQKVVSLVLNYCNSRCPHFYFNYEDGDNIWCMKLNKRVYDSKGTENRVFDFSTRKIPKVCPLDDFNG